MKMVGDLVWRININNEIKPPYLKIIDNEWVFYLTKIVSFNNKGRSVSEVVKDFRGIPKSFIDKYKPILVNR